MKRTSITRRWFFAVASIAAAALSMLPQGVAGKEAEAEEDLTAEHRFALGNQYLELGFQRKGDQIAATTLHNRVANRTITLTSDDFALSREGQQALHSSDFKVHQVLRTRIPGGQRLRLISRSGASELVVIYELLDANFFLRRHLEFSPGAPLLLRAVDVWKVGLEDRCSHQETGPPDEMLHNVWGVDRKTGFGKPVFLEDTFWGLEFPAGYNHYATGYLTLSHVPGRMVSDKFISKTAVMGVAPAGLVSSRFRAYIAQERHRPSKPEVQVDYNTWTTVSPATESNSLELIRQFKKNLFDPYGVSFDSFTLDDGWDEKNSLWELRTSGFPNSFKPLLDALQPMGTKLGLWLSPSSGYEHAGWGAQNGFTRNATLDWFLCQSDPAYRSAMCRVVPDLIHKNDVGFFKMDGFCASCDTQQHAHHLDGDFAREANVDAFIELLTAMRKTKPDVYLDPTSGMWLSPWWLWYVDSVYADTYDGTPPAMVPSPNGFDGATSIRDALLRRRITANPGFDPAAIETLGVYLDPTLAIEPKSFFDNWHDNAMMVAGRGNRLLTFYMNPATFPHPERDWPFLADMIKWARHNGSTLARSEMILGDPYLRQTYGYSHFHGQQGIVAIRNPFIEPQQVHVKLDESAGWLSEQAGAGRYVARIVYPYQETLRQDLRHGDSLELNVQSYQMVVLQIEPVNPAAMLLTGVRSREIKRNSDRISWEVFGAPGESIDLALKDFPARQKITLNGRDVSTHGVIHGGKKTIVFEGKKSPCVIVGGNLQTAKSNDGMIRLSGSCKATIPHGTKAFLYALGLDPSPADLEFQCHATMNGIAIPATQIHTLAGSEATLRPVRELPLKPWVFFRIPVPEGKNEIAISIESASPDKKASQVEVGWWLWTEQPLQKNILTMEFAEPLPAAPINPLPFPSALESRREVHTLQSLKPFHF